MKRVFFYISIVTLFTSLASCGSSPTSTNDTVYLDDALLWRISGNNLTADSYLLGTLHLIPTSFLDSIPIIPTIIQNTDCIMSEVDMNTKLSTLSGLEILDVSKVLLPPNIKYTDLYSIEDYYLLDDLLYRRGLDSPDKIRLSPIMLMTLLSLPEGRGNNSKIMFDSYLVQQAVASGKEVLFLESMEEQFKSVITYINSKFPENCSIEEQAKGLIEYAKRNYSDSLHNNLYDNYINQRLSKMDVSPEMNDMLIRERNKNWMPKILKQIKIKPTFIFVGALHLIGENGLIYQLRKQGYEVTPVK